MSKALAPMQLALPTGSLDAYIQTISHIPVLTAEEEHDLAVRLQEQNDLEAARRLVMSHLRFVAHIARSYSGYGLPQADLIQEGNIGLMKAVKRFDHTKGVRLVSFAVHWIRAEIHEYILKNWRIVKVATTKAQRKLFFNLRSAKKRLGWFTAEEAERVADDLGVPTKTVYEMESRLNGHDVGFDGYNDNDDSNEHQALAPSTYLFDASTDPAKQVEHADAEEYSHQRLHYALADLDERSRDILQARWLTEDKATLQELADKYQVSAERIRQLEKNAMKKLKNVLEV